jgi:hypothetical protein
MQMHGDGAPLKMKVRAHKRSGDLFGIPPEIERCMAHRIILREEFRAVVKHHGRTVVARAVCEGIEPLVSLDIARIREAARVHIGKAGESFVLRGDGIGDHPADDCGGRSIQPAYEHQVGVVGVPDGCIVAEIRIHYRPGDG